MPAGWRWRPRWLVGVGGLCLVLFGGIGTTHAGQAATAVPIRAQVILASNQGTGTDDRLGPVAKQLSEAFKYSRYELLASHNGTPQVAQAWQAALPGSRTLEVTPTSIAEGVAVLQVRVLGPKGEAVMNSSVRLPPGRTVFIGGPPQSPGVLIIALSAS